MTSVHTIVILNHPSKLHLLIDALYIVPLFLSPRSARRRRLTHRLTPRARVLRRHRRRRPKTPRNEHGKCHEQWWIRQPRAEQ